MPRRKDGERVLPVFYSNTMCPLLPGESKSILVRAARKQLQEQEAVVVVDGWNVKVAAKVGRGVAIDTNVNAMVKHWPETNLPFQTEGLRMGVWWLREELRFSRVELDRAVV